MVRAATAALVLCLAAQGSVAGWDGFRAIVWHQQPPGSCDALKAAGIDAGAFIAANRERPALDLERRMAPFKDCGLSWYVENIATDFYSAYHRYFQDKPVNWRFVELKEAYRANPADRRAFVRDPSLSDPAWQRRIAERLAEAVRAHRGFRPLYYSLGDEPGIADLSAFWDFDVSRDSVEGFRRWLEARYGSVVALNAQWGSRFAGWDAVVPETTAEAMKRRDGNWSAWADFKEWMDEAFARALAQGTEAVHAADPAALAAIEGAQIPGWGGYDYSRLARAVDVVELYDGGGNLEILRSLNPNLVLLTTSSESTKEAHGLWRAFLRGTRGVIFWDPKGGIAGERGRALAPVLREIKGEIGALLMRSERRTSPVAVLYSPASMRAQWMRDWQPKGSAWSDRDPSGVYEDASAVRDSMAAFLDRLARSGLEPRVATPALIEEGLLDRGIRVLVLPRVLALSAKEAARIRSFAAGGGVVVAEGTPGQYDEHCRRLAKPALADLFEAGKATQLKRGWTTDALVSQLAAAGVEPAFELRRPDGARATHVEAHVFEDGDTTILALQREPSGASAEPLRLVLRESATVYDLRERRVKGTVKSLEVLLDAVAPTVLRLTKPAP